MLAITSCTAPPVAQKPPSQAIATTVPVPSAMGTAASDPCMSADQAIARADEGDGLVHTDVDAAIAKYLEATQLDPENHAIAWRLARAYEIKQDWESMIPVVERATELAPDFANYWFRLGYARLKWAEEGHPEQYQRAKAPLEHCIHRDPGHSECYHFLAEADLFTDDVRGAIEAYSQAIEHDCKVAYFYPPLADLYLGLKLYGDAERVVNEGVSAITPSAETAGQLYNLYLLRFEIAQARDDTRNMIAALEKANEANGDAHPEINFNLGSSYAIMKPPRKADARRLLNLFYKLVCRGTAASKFVNQCEEANVLIQRLGYGPP